MQWYKNRIPELEKAPPVISVCGDDCGVCPRYLAGTEKELHETAVFWHKAGWRDHVVSNEEIRCTGCGCRPTCSFMMLPCTREHGVSACRECASFACEKVWDMYVRSEEKSGSAKKHANPRRNFACCAAHFMKK